MNKTQKILLGVLVAQLLLVVLVFWPKPKAVENRDAVFAERMAEEVSRFSVADGNGNEVTILKNGEDWMLSDPEGYPVESSKVDTMLDDLFNVHYGRFVAENKSSHDRLEVGQEKFNRRITLTYASGEKQTFMWVPPRQPLQRTSEWKEMIMSIYPIS